MTRDEGHWSRVTQWPNEIIQSKNQTGKYRYVHWIIFSDEMLFLWYSQSKFVWYLFKERNIGKYSLSFTYRTEDLPVK